MQVLTVFLFVFLRYQYVTAYSCFVPGARDVKESEILKTAKLYQEPDVYKFHVYSAIQFRFARTVVSSSVANPANVSQEVSFSAVLPNTAFITGFLMEIDGNVYNAHVEDKEAAKYEYHKAVKRGRTAGHVAFSARDSNRFTVSVNVEPQKNVTFNLTYEELLNRKLGIYEHVINLDPGQVVRDFRVEVHINEPCAITSLQVPPLRTSNEIPENPESEENPLAIIERPTPHTAIVKYAPTPRQQEALYCHRIRGQLIVKYDVNRTSNAGEVIVNNGYFVHFFAPTVLCPLPKLVTFVLDVSSSMRGRKINQLRLAMLRILDDLNHQDFFSIILFSTTVTVWDSIMGNTATTQSYQIPERMWPRYKKKMTPIALAKATPENINKAKRFVQNLRIKSNTNIHGALMKALEVSRLGDDTELDKLSFEENNDIFVELEKYKHRHEPIIIFLTDGQPNVGVRDTDKIVSSVTNSNTGKFSIFSLALGNDANMKFLQKLSLRNSGFARKIYEASDTALQLTDFYRQVASPLLANVTFKYLPQQVDEESVTKQIFAHLFGGAELVVAGKLPKNHYLKDNMTVEVLGRSFYGPTKYPLTIPSPRLNKTNSSDSEKVSSMERMWAYLTIKQLLEEDDKEHNRDQSQTSPGKQRALQLALQYSFVTPLTSLVVKPNEVAWCSVDTENASTDGTFSYASNPGRDSYHGVNEYEPPSIPAQIPLMDQPPGVNEYEPPSNRPQIPLMDQPPGANEYESLSIPAPLSWMYQLPDVNEHEPPTLPAPILLMDQLSGVNENEPPSTGIIPAPIPWLYQPPGVNKHEPPSKKITLASLSWMDQPPVHSTHVLANLSDVKWLKEYQKYIFLPTGFYGKNEVLLLAGANETNIAHSPCWTPTSEPGVCRHFRYCVLQTFISDKREFLPHVCRINRFVGVCCPDYLTPIEDTSYINNNNFIIY